jgi:hypothetical protein
VPGGVEVFRRVFVLRRIATADVSARQANTEMHPAIAGFDAILANPFGRPKVFRIFQVFTMLH